MGKRKFKNFDAMFAEMKTETISFRMFGKMYEIPKQIPAHVVLEMARMENNEELSFEFLIKAAVQIFGQDIMDDLCTHREFSANKLSELIRWAFEEINGKANEDDMEEITEDDVGVVESKN